MTPQAAVALHNLSTMAVAPRARPEDHFTAAQWLTLGQRSRWRGLWLVAHCWGVIALAMVVGARWPLLIPLCVMVVGTRQLGLAILMHDAAHGLLHPNRRVNDGVGHWLCAPTLRAYRPYHLQHHRYVQQAEDPDLVLSAPFPISRASFWRKVWRDLSGQTFYKQRIQPLWQGGAKAAGGDAASAFAGHDRHFLVANALGFALFAAVGWWWVWLLLWALPMATWLPLVTRLRNIAEHALVATPEKALTDLIHLTPGGDSEAWLRELRLTGLEKFGPDLLEKTAGQKPKIRRAMKRLMAQTESLA